MWILGTAQVASCMSLPDKVDPFYAVRLYRTLFFWLPPVWKWNFSLIHRGVNEPNDVDFVFVSGRYVHS